MLTQKDLEDGIRRASLPGPSDDLRARVLSAAVVSPGSISWSDRMWFSRKWRAAAVAAAVAVLVLEQLSASSQTVHFTPTAQAEIVELAAREAGLPPAAVTALARRVRVEAPRVQTPAESAASAMRALDALEIGGTQ